MNTYRKSSGSFRSHNANPCPGCMWFNRSNQKCEKPSKIGYCKLLRS